MTQYTQYHNFHFLEKEKLVKQSLRRDSRRQKMRQSLTGFQKEALEVGKIKNKTIHIKKPEHNKTSSNLQNQNLVKMNQE